MQVTVQGYEAHPIAEIREMRIALTDDPVTITRALFRSVQDHDWRISAQLRDLLGRIAQEGES